MWGKEIVEAPPADDVEKKIEVPYAPEVGVQVNVQELEPAVTDAAGESKNVIQVQAPQVEKIGEVYVDVVEEAQAAQRLASELAEELMEARAAAWAARAEADHAGRGDLRPEPHHADRAGLSEGAGNAGQHTAEADRGHRRLEAHHADCDDRGARLDDLLPEGGRADLLAGAGGGDHPEALRADRAGPSEGAGRAGQHAGSAVDADGDVSVEKMDNVHVVVRPGPPLPPGWEAATDPASGKPYFFHRADGMARWDPPTLQEEEERQIERQIRLARIRRRVG